jgi:hypothetical protein
LLHFVREGIGCTGEYTIDVARARYVEKKLQEHQMRVGGTAEHPIVVKDEGNQDEDDTARLSDLIALAKAGLQADKEDDDTGRLSELIGLAEAGLHAEEDEDAFFSQAVEAVDEAETAYYRRKADRSNAGEPSHMTEAEENALFSQATDEAEAAYYCRQADRSNAGDPSHSIEVVVEDWYSDDELLTQYAFD